jgi:hypothetical protein
VRRSAGGGHERLDVVDLAFQDIRHGVAAVASAAPGVVVDREIRRQFPSERSVLRAVVETSADQDERRSTSEAEVTGEL